MKKRNSYLLLLFLLGSMLLTMSGCDYTSGERFNQLSVKIAGEGYVEGEDYETIYDFTILDVSRNSSVSLEARPLTDESEFLFWTGDGIENLYDNSQRILMDRDRDVIAVFGDDNVFMSGYITEVNQNTDVLGYWKALAEYPHLEVYLRGQRDSQEFYRYIFDQDNFEDDSDSGEIIYITDGANSQYIAAIMRIEESDLGEFEEATRYLFVYIDRRGFETVVLPDEPEYKDIYDDTLEEDGEDFIEQVRQIIDDHRQDDLILGNTATIDDTIFD